MSFDFELLLVLLTIFTGLIALASYFILNFKYTIKSKIISLIIDQSKSLFPIFFIVLILRSFI